MSLGLELDATLQTSFKTQPGWNQTFQWQVVELCERWDWLIQLDAEFYELPGKRNIITILTDGEKDPIVMGFTLVDGEAQNFPVQPEGDLAVQVDADEDEDEDDDGDDDDDMDVPGEVIEQHGRDIPEGQTVVHPNAEDEIDVNGTKLKMNSALLQFVKFRFKTDMFSDNSGPSKAGWTGNGDVSCKGCTTADGEATKVTSHSQAAIRGRTGQA